MKKMTKTVGLLSLTFAAILLLAVSALAGDTKYVAISEVTKDITQGTSGTFQFQAISPALPSTGSSRATPYETLYCNGGHGVPANFIAKDLTYEGAPFDFSSWFNITPPSYCYAGADITGPIVSAVVTVPSDAAVGAYGAKLVAKGPNGIGWGEAAGVHITINVLQAVSCDTSEPEVTIYKPTEEQDFTLGKKVAVEFTAIDEQSPITGWTALLNPGTAYEVNIASLLTESTITDGKRITGDISAGLATESPVPTITKIGRYTLRAGATSQQAGCDPLTGYADRRFDVNYNIYPIAPHLTETALICDRNAGPASKPKCGGSGKDLQIKFAAKAFSPPESSTEVFVSDNTVRVVVKRDSDSSVLINRTFGSGSPESYVTIGSAEYLTKVADTIWTTWTSGTYTIYVYFDDFAGGDFLQYTKTFTVQD